MAAQRSTCTHIKITTTADARVIFHAVFMNVLPMITRRLDNTERSHILPGDVYVWEERGANTETSGTGIERWTDGLRWGPSRVRDGFLYYQEKQDEGGLFSATQIRPSSSQKRSKAAQTVLTKQTYTVNVEFPGGTKKWHLIAYYTEVALPSLRSVDDVPELALLKPTVPYDRYKAARAAKGRPEHIFNPPTGAESGPVYNRLEYVQYTPPGNGSSSAGSSSPMAMPTSPVSPSTSGRHRGLYNSTYHHSPPSPPPSFNPSSSPGAFQLHRIPSPIMIPDAYSSGDEADRAAHNRAMPPLTYLKGISPPRRTPEDDRALSMFQPDY